MSIKHYWIAHLTTSIVHNNLAKQIYTNKYIKQINIYLLIESTPYYYLKDIRGLMVAMTKATGNTLDTNTYDPYGTQLTSTGTTQNAIKYVNGYQDATTSLYKYGARYYNPAEGRWTQSDPSGIDAHYVYANNNPVNFSDPSGYDARSTLQCVGGSISIAGGVVSLIGAGISAASTPITTAAGAGAFLGFAGAGIGLIGAGASQVAAC